MSKLGDLKKSEKDRLRKIKTLEAEIVKIKADLAGPVKLEPIEDIVADHVCFFFHPLVGQMDQYHESVFRKC
jgi:hypothetical protein